MSEQRRDEDPMDAARRNLAMVEALGGKSTKRGRRAELRGFLAFMHPDMPEERIRKLERDMEAEQP